MKRILVTGAGGMIGSHLVEYLSPESEVIGTSFRPTVRLDEIGGAVRLLRLDVRDWPSVRESIGDLRPSVIYHLAAQSLPTVSWIDPWDTIDTNVQGTINVFEAIREVRKTAGAEYDPMIVVACSSAEYGASLTPERSPITEEAPLLPLHPYGVSKVAQDLLSYQYWRSDSIRCIRARIFNTTGPRKQNDVVSDFAARVVRIQREGGSLRVGNLSAQRAILDVRDMVRALALLAERGEPGEAYNICADRAYPIRDLIPVFEQLCGRPLPIKQDPSLLRPTDEPLIFGSSAKLRKATNWRPELTLDETLRRVYEYENAHFEIGSEISSPSAAPIVI